ncbi:MAG: isoaspartyl peptidase/L-asparaginase, partial [Candidatus Latescibacteria bacterium]|nr:isoaspartyl peptidase/L-asparaginase [Candidatus Latescibacterota bacterium]
MSGHLSRRRFLTQGGAAVLGLSVSSALSHAQTPRSSSPALARAALPAAFCIYSPEGAQTAGETLMKGGSALDAAEQGMRAVENVLPPQGYNVGLSAVLNARGEAELDASIMDGRTHRSGAVGALQG